MTATLVTIVACVAGLLGEPTPVDDAGIVFPVVRLVPKSDILRPVPNGWPADAWNRRAGGRFIPGPRSQPRAARVEIAETAGPPLDRILAHEIAHFVLWANGREYRHFTRAGHQTRASHLITWATSKYRRWCAPAVDATLEQLENGKGKENG